MSNPASNRSTTRLPGRLMPFVGRQAERDRMLALFNDPAIRLITIVGPGGVGKTAFALEVAEAAKDRFENGVVFVPLANVRTIDEVLPAIAAALDVQLPPRGDLLEAVLEQLSGMQALLLLDSFEQVLDEAPLLCEILAAAPRVRILATSREKLSLEAETLFTLGGLDVPGSEGEQDAGDYDAVRLFLQKARQARPGFSLEHGNGRAVVQICRMVDGNPLGILLAASWVEHFSAEEILREAGSNLDFLSRKMRDEDPRHSCMRAVLESSFKRLDDSDKLIFRKLGVFPASFDLHAARAVAGAGLPNLIALTDKFMLSREPDSGRYELHDLLRKYALEQLDAAGEREQCLAVHQAYYTGFVVGREPGIISHEQDVVLDEIQADLGNIRQAWSRVVEARSFDAAGAMMPCLYAFSDMRSRFYEGEAIFRQAVEGLAPRDGETPQPAWALALLSWYDLRTYIERFSSYEKMIAQAQRCLEAARANHQPDGEAASLVLLSAMAQHQKRSREALEYCKQAMQIYPALDDMYWVNMRIGIAYQEDRQYDEAIRAFRVCLERGERTGEKVKAGWSNMNIGDTLCMQGKAAQAGSYLEKALALFQQAGTRAGVVGAIVGLSRVAIALGDRGRARQLAEEASRLAEGMHSASWTHRTDELMQSLDPSFTPKPVPAQDASLSERELEVLQLLKTDLTGPEIARRLVVSLNTVRFHTKHIYQKLGVSTRLEAIHRAEEMGL